MGQGTRERGRRTGVPSRLGRRWGEIREGEGAEIEDVPPPRDGDTGFKGVARSCGPWAVDRGRSISGSDKTSS